jgi:ABC-2 type transport system permease protein
MAATTALLARRLHRLKREPFNVTFTLSQPLIWLLLYSNLMSRATLPGAEGVPYPTFMLAGVIAFTVFGNSLAGGIPVLFDKENGFLTRLLAAPIPRSSIILSQFAYVSMLTVAQVLLVTGLGAVVLGAKIATGFPGLLVILAISTLLGLGLTVLSLALAFSLHGHGEFFAIIGFAGLPLLFLSSALVPLETMPEWMRIAAWLNPMTHATNAIRGLVIHGWNWGQLALSVAVIAAFDAAFLTLGLRALRKRLA